MNTDKNLTEQMEIIKGALLKTPKWELVKLLMFFYFSAPANALDAVDIWKDGNTKIGDTIKKYL